MLLHMLGKSCRMVYATIYNKHTGRGAGTGSGISGSSAFLRFLSGGATADDESLSGGVGSAAEHLDSHATPQDLKFTKLSETTIWCGRYKQIKSAQWRFPNDKIVTFDILSQGGDKIQARGSVTVFSFNRQKRTATLVREFHPGPEDMQWGTINGMYEKDKHASPLVCGQMELEEEAQQQQPLSGCWIPLLDSPRGACLDKYSDNHFFPYLVLDAVAVGDPRAPDDEEFILVERDVGYDQMMRMVKAGKINVASSYCVLMAYAKLDELGIPYR